MDAITLLKADHDKVADLLDKADKTTENGVKTREELFLKIIQELTLHAKVEEDILYPKLLKIKEMEDLSREATEEHHEVKFMLKELDELPKDHPQWGAKLTVLKENITHHVKEEEKEMFPQMKSYFSKEQLEEMGAAMEEEKKMLKPRVEEEIEVMKQQAMTKAE
ncbi:MAG: hemerythrin domain-containing protein [Candidatus Gracilibacteria bacterium]